MQRDSCKPAKLSSMAVMGCPKSTTDREEGPTQGSWRTGRERSGGSRKTQKKTESRGDEVCRGVPAEIESPVGQADSDDAVKAWRAVLVGLAGLGGESESAVITLGSLRLIVYAVLFCTVCACTILYSTSEGRGIVGLGISERVGKMRAKDGGAYVNKYLD